jgi:hypothetical protein
MMTPEQGGGCALLWTVAHGLDSHSAVKAPDSRPLRKRPSYAHQFVDLDLLRKLSPKRKQWLDARTRRHHRRRRVHARSWTRVTYLLDGRTGTARAMARTPMPNVFCLEENYEESAACLAVLRKRLEVGTERAVRQEMFRQRRHIRTVGGYNDFTTIEKCSPSAALVLAAEYDKSRSIVKWNVPLLDLPRWKSDLVTMLDEIGFFRLLEIPRPKARASATGVRVLQFQTGHLVARNEAATLTDTLQAMVVAATPELENDPTFQTTVMQLLGAIQEATENACDHAYRGTATPDVNRRWWATGSIDISRRHLNLVVYDQGRSIPATLPEWEKYPFIQSRIARFQRRFKEAIWGDDLADAIKMRLAMDAPTSSTGEGHRGKGFVLFRRVVEQSVHARLRILSRNGEFIYDKAARPRVRGLKTPLSGTLVEWDLWL